MKYEIKFSLQALDHLKYFRKFEQKIIIDSIKKQLLIQPFIPTKNRKLLNENPVAQGTPYRRLSNFLR